MQPTKDEMEIGFTWLDLARLKQWAEGIAGQWNGDEPGLQEDRASIANEIIEKANELQDLLDEISED